MTRGPSLSEPKRDNAERDRHTEALTQRLSILWLVPLVAALAALAMFHDYLAAHDRTFPADYRLSELQSLLGQVAEQTALSPRVSSPVSSASLLQHIDHLVVELSDQGASAVPELEQLARQWQVLRPKLQEFEQETDATARGPRIDTIQDALNDMLVTSRTLDRQLLQRQRTLSTQMGRLLLLVAVLNGLGLVLGMVLLHHHKRALGRARALLARSNERFRSLVESTHDWMWEVDGDGRYTYSSPQVETILGYSPQQILGRTPFEFMEPKEAQRVLDLAEPLMARREPILALENTNLHCDGHHVILETSGVPYYDSDGNYCGYRGIDRDISARKQAENALRASESRYRAIFESLQDVFFRIDVDGRIVTVSPSATTMFGFGADELQRMTVMELSAEPEQMRQLLRRIAAHREIHDHEQKVVRKDGTPLWVSVTARLIMDHEQHAVGIEGLARDISERRQTQQQLQDSNQQLRESNRRLEDTHQQLLQSEKMASIGQLAAGVAHEINNPVGYINSNIAAMDKYVSDLFRMLDAFEQEEPRIDDANARQRLQRLRDELDLPFLKQDVRELLSETRQGIDRVRNIVQDLKDFSRPGSGDNWAYADLHKGLESTLNVVWNELKYKAEVIRDYGELPEVFCIASQLNQVFLNLLVNAAQAIEGRGTIYIRTRKEDNDRVSVEITDTGCGIDPEHMAHLFDPFFTTKPVGKGTGLGLSLSYGIVEHHRGRIEAHSDPGKGSTFRVWLPIEPPGDYNSDSTPHSGAPQIP